MYLAAEHLFQPEDAPSPLCAARLRLAADKKHVTALAVLKLFGLEGEPNDQAAAFALLENAAKEYSPSACCWIGMSVRRGFLESLI